MKVDLSSVSEGVLSSVTPLCQNVVYHGQVQAVYHQGEKKNRLMTLNEPIKVVTIESSADTQLAWLADTLIPSSSKAYGMGGRIRYLANMQLLILSQKADTLGAVLQALSGPFLAQVINVDMNTLRVIREGWLTDVGDDKNYNPSLNAWLIRCQIDQVELVSSC